MNSAWIGLGSNLGDSGAVLRRALSQLAALDNTQVRAVSPAYWTEPWGDSDQPRFLNAVAKLATSLIPEHLLAALLGIEQRLGRVRDGKRWGPRTLDLDLLVYDQLSVDTPNLVVPHPRMHERAFVLVPLNDLSPQLEVPGLGQVGNLLAALDDKERSGVRRASPLDESPPPVSELVS